MRFFHTQKKLRTKRKNRRFSTVFRSASLAAVFVACGTTSFFLGLQTVRNVNPVGNTIAQAAQSTIVNVILQVQPSTGGTPRPIEVTPFMNSSTTALVHLQEVHTGRIVPASANDRCKTTNSLGRCSIRNVPVGPDANAGLASVNQQYDILVDTVFLEFLTRIPLETLGASVRFDSAKCNGNQTSFTQDGWCLTKNGAAFAAEYFVTITLKERNNCIESAPPAAFCDASGKLVTFDCNPSFVGATRPWEPKPRGCETVQCPDGNLVGGVCSEISSQLAACSTAEACRNNLLCSVTNFGSNITYDAGVDTIVIRGERFGTAGGTVSFLTTGNARETVEVFPGSNWTDTEIRVRVPQNAISGDMRIHPHTHGFTEAQDGSLTAVTCNSPIASIRAFKDQFAILFVRATPPDGVRLVAPGFTTELQILVRHNENVGKLQKVLVELLDGSFSSPDSLPLNRTVIAQATCPVQPAAGGTVNEAVFLCGVPVPQSASVFHGPFTFLITVIDASGGTERAVLAAPGSSVIAGDFNFDGSITIEDAVIGRRLATGAQSTTSDHRLRDVDADNVITMIDVLYVLHSLTE